MADKELKDFLDELNKVGPGFCAAKWYNATIWLNNGRTASCHHPHPHKALDFDMDHDISGMHNTDYKKKQRKAMLEGDRPSECGYCWRVEDADKNQISDRVYKSQIYSKADIDKIANLHWNENVNPKTLEISFDNLCNLDCSYCNSEFSSTWSNDLKTNGSYDNLTTEGSHVYDKAVEFDYKEETKYVTRFLEWYDNGLKDDLEELRVTGGEPSRSPHFWKLLDKIEGADYRFAVNSNLIMDKARLDKLIGVTGKFKEFDLFTSCEAYGSQAEFIRHGLDYNMWKENLLEFCSKATYRSVNVMMTINALCLFSITEFLDDLASIREQYDNVYFSVNILRFPFFQSVNILPEHIKTSAASALQQWVNTNAATFHAWEIEGLNRLVSYLQHVDTAYEDKNTQEEKEQDFYNFYSTYALRRGLDIDTAFVGTEFIDWWNTLKSSYRK